MTKSSTLIPLRDLKRRWVCFEEVPNVNHFNIGICHRPYVWDFPRFGAGNFMTAYLGEIRRGYMKMWFIEDQFDESSNYIVRKMVANPSWTKKVNGKVERYTDELFSAADRFRTYDFSTMSNRELFRAFSRLYRPLEIEWAWGQVTTYVADANKQYFTQFLQDELRSAMGKSRFRGDFASVFSLLTTPLRKSWAEREEESFHSIAAEIASDCDNRNLFLRKKPTEIIRRLRSLHPRLYARIVNHYEKFLWLPYMYEGPSWSLQYFIENWKNIFREGVDVREKHREVRARKNTLKKQQQSVLKRLQPSSQLHSLLRVAREIVWLKAYRKDGVYYASFCLEPWYREVGKRFGYSVRALRQVLPWEITLVFKRKLSQDELLERYHYGVFVVRPRVSTVVTGKEAKAIVQSISATEQPVRTSELRGTPACAGKVQGVVKIVNIVEDMKKMKIGDVLVSNATNPNLVPAMKKAAAIVTNSGGLTCHAAIVSRELKIPCVVGTKIATKVLKDGDQVEVDATKGLVRKR